MKLGSPISSFSRIDLTSAYRRSALRDQEFDPVFDLDFGVDRLFDEATLHRLIVVRIEQKAPFSVDGDP